MEFLFGLRTDRFRMCLGGMMSKHLPTLRGQLIDIGGEHHCTGLSLGAARPDPFHYQMDGQLGMLAAIEQCVLNVGFYRGLEDARPTGEYGLPASEQLS